MANEWTEISNLEGDYLGAALGLLQATMEGYNGLSISIMQRKMRPGGKPETDLFCLRVFSYGDPADLKHPSVSAFFFLRRVHAPPGQSKPWAFCMTVGTVPDSDSKALAAAPLKSALADVCTLMRPIAGAAQLEVMHAQPRPVFKVDHTYFESVYNDVTTAGAAPRLKEKDTTITVQDPWADPGQPQELIWLEIIES